jgi:hypothetical protein
MMPRIFQMKEGKAKKQIMLDASDLDELSFAHYDKVCHIS